MDDRLDRFEIRRVLGKGAFGTVYEAFDPSANRTVALKVLPADPKLHAQFSALVRIEHDGLVRLFDCVDHGAQILVAMELVEGCDFVSHVRGPRDRAPGRPTLPLAFGTPLQEGGLSAFSSATRDEIARLRPALGKLGSAIAALHAQRLVHRDLTPSNVLVTTGGRVVVLDFGLVATVGEERAGIVGTPAYMAPESTITAAADWYSLGVILFECLTGALPFAGSAQEMMVRKQTVSAPRPSFVVDLEPDAHDLDHLCERLLRREPDQRPNESEILEATTAKL